MMRQREEMSFSTSHFISHSAFKTYFPWSKWKTIHWWCERMFRRFKDDRFLTPSTRSFTSSRDVWHCRRIPCIVLFCYVKVKPGCLTKRCKTLNGSRGHGGFACRRHLLLYDNEMENNISLRIRRLLCRATRWGVSNFLASVPAEVWLDMTKV